MTKLQSSFLVGLSESYLADIGRVIAAWSQVESYFDVMLLLPIVASFNPASNQQDLDPGKIMGLPFKRRVKEFKTRVDLFDLPVLTRESIKQATDNLSDLRKKRDEVAHSMFTMIEERDDTISSDKARSIFKSWKSEKDHRIKTLNQKDLKRTFERIEALYWDLHTLSLDQDIRAQRPRQQLRASPSLRKTD